MATYFPMIAYIICLSLCGVGNALLSETVLDKDLYSILGLGKNCTTQEIKKSFRSLGKIYHPDKIKSPEDKSFNEIVFREIAEAYDILVDANLRHEYDLYQQQKVIRRNQESIRKKKVKRNQKDSKSSYNHGKKTQKNRHQWSHHFYDNSLAGYSLGSFFIPKVYGPFVPAGQILNPYSPIIASTNRAYFTFLDKDCSLVICRGDIEAIQIQLIRGLVPDLMALGYDVIFETPRKLSLNGNCYANLDQSSGALIIYNGRPDSRSNIDVEKIWSSSSVLTGPKRHHYLLHFLEITDEGELFVRRWNHFEAPGEHIWSSKHHYPKTYVNLQSLVRHVCDAISLLKINLLVKMLSKCIATFNNAFTRSFIYIKTVASNVHIDRGRRMFNKYRQNKTEVLLKWLNNSSTWRRLKNFTTSHKIESLKIKTQIGKLWDSIFQGLFTMIL